MDKNETYERLTTITKIGGEILSGAHPAYDTTRKVWNGLVDRRPSVIVRAADTSDIAEVINFSRENDLLLSVRGGGHSFAGRAVCDNGVMLDLSAMRSVVIDPDSKTARVQGGATWADVDGAAQRFGLATTGGLISHTGVGGLTLGGGIGWLARKYGLAIDNLLSARLVTSGGVEVGTSEHENPDLFWAIRGGGGNFGVVTEFEFRVHPVGPEVFGGFLIYPFEAAEKGLKVYREFSLSCPDEVGCYAMFGRIPPAPEIPERYHGKVGFFIAVAFFGPEEDAESVIAPLRSFASPILDAVQRTPYAVLQQLFDEAQKPGNRWYGKSGFWHEIPDDAIRELLRGVEDMAGELTLVFFESMGGAVSRVSIDATAFPHRSAPFNFGITCGWADQTEDEANIQWTRNLHESLSRYEEGIYMNYADADETGKTTDTFGSNLDRLREVKTKWDPYNLFKVNVNVLPTT